MEKRNLKLVVRIISILLAITVTVASLPMLVFAEELSGETVSPASEATGTTTYTYRDAVGTESYYPSFSHGATGQDTGIVNLTSGALTYVLPLISTTDNLIPYTVSLIYNSTMAGVPHDSRTTHNAYPESYMPYGFKLNICETLDFYGLINEYIYEDSDGTAHTFVYDNGLYRDTDGLQLTLEAVNAGTIRITDIDKTVKTFVEVYENKFVLEQISDRYGNSVLVQLDQGNNPGIIFIQPNGQNAIRMLVLLYTTDGKLKAIYNPYTLDAVVLRYSETTSGTIGSGASNYLRQVDYIKCAEGATSATISSFAQNASNNTNVLVCESIQYTYSSFGDISEIASLLTGKRISYEKNTDNKINKVVEYGGNNIGQSVEISYFDGYTELLSSGSDDALGNADDTVTRYVFDEHGRAKSVYSTSKDGTVVYGANTGEYEEQDNVKNNLKTSTVLGGHSANYLVNGDFEDSHYDAYDLIIDYWTMSGDVEKASELEFSGIGFYCAKFNPEIDTPASLSQVVVLPAGEYTLSFDYNCGAMEFVYGNVKIESTSESGFTHVDSFPRATTINNGRFGTYATTFTVPDYINGGDTVRVTLEFSKLAENTTVYESSILVNNVMLSLGNGAAPFNYISFGSFDSTSLETTWEDAWQNQFQVHDSETGFGYSASLPGGDTTSSIKQSIVELTSHTVGGPSADHDYILTGFAYVTGVEDASQIEILRLRAAVNYFTQTEGSYYTKDFYFDFLPGVSGWQFAGGSFSAGREEETTGADGNTTRVYDYVKSIDVYCEYKGPSGSSVYFDNLSLVVEDGANLTKYRYYEDGLVAIKQTVHYREFYEYNANGDLYRIGNNRGEMTEFTYDSDGRIVCSVDYTFVNRDNGSLTYPLEIACSENQSTDKYLEQRTPVTASVYEYNDYGQAMSVTTYNNLAIGDGTNEVEILAVFNDYEGNELRVVVTAQSDKLFTEYTYITTSGSHIFGAIETEKSEEVYSTRYFYDELDGKLLATVNTQKGTGTSYEYDSYDRLVTVLPLTYSSTTENYTASTSAEKVQYGYDTLHRLTSIQTQSTTYHLTYDGFGNDSVIGVGSSVLASYEYNDNNGKLKKVTYGNGHIEEYVYNTLEMLSEIWYTDSEGTSVKAFSYEYDSEGRLHKLTDERSGENTVYRYDDKGRFTGSSQYNDSDMEKDFSVRVTYDARNGRVLDYIYYLNYVNGGTPYAASQSLYYVYNDDGSLNYVDRGSWTDYFTFDDFDRVTVVHHKYGTGTALNYYERYEYRTYGDGCTDALVSKYTSTVNGTATVNNYTYDASGYIKTETKDGKTYTYTYDDLGQLIQVSFGNIYTYYNYDNAGNIINVKSFVKRPGGTGGEVTLAIPSSPVTIKTFGYTDSEWGDLLTSYNGNAITYDAIGNPLTYHDGTTFTWEGRRLISATKGGVTYTYTYNDEGLRTSKTVNGVTTEYYWDGGLLIAEKSPSEIVFYSYDSSGVPAGMRYCDLTAESPTWESYWFTRSLQGDVTAVYNTSGTKLVSYTYNAWGEISVTYSNGGASTGAVKNNLKYRG